ncbi:acyl-CoA dehydrogenase family protein [Nocardioides endophyticus]|uniref:acyl-CoA dehydrogenase family protein n=1 Tax=Nocardioides endophyticus TaxID=1353775 RepID=UPI003CD0B29F
MSSPRRRLRSQQAPPPRSLWHSAAGQGLLGLEVPEAHGGAQAGDYRFTAALLEELAAIDVALASCLSIHFDVVSGYLVHLTNDEQRERWPPGFCSGALVSAIAMTEPEAARTWQPFAPGPCGMGTTGCSTAPRPSSPMGLGRRGRRRGPHQRSRGERDLTVLGRSGSQGIPPASTWHRHS